MKYLSYFCLVFLFASCGVRTLEGRAWPVYFSADDVVFSDSLDPKPSLWYHGPTWLSYPCADVIELEPGKQVKAMITGPTIFTMNDKNFLVNPKDKIRVTADPSHDFAPSLYTQNQKKRRDRELQVLKSFQEQEHAPKVVRLIDFDYQTILNLESTLKEQIEPAEHASQLLFDSLKNAYQVGRKFKRSTKDFVRNRYESNVLSLYWLYRDTLFARGVYYEKVREYLTPVNNLGNRERLNANMVWHINFLNTSLFPTLGVNGMVRQGKFDACFDLVSTTFVGPARDLLLSRLIFHAYVLGYSVPENYAKQYRKYSINKDYKKVLARTKVDYDTVQFLGPILPNDLLMVDGSSTTRWENVLAQNKGKYVLVDFWASWCVPCLNDLPALSALKQQYPTDKIAFLSFSMDKNVAAWKSQLLKQNSDTANNFLIVHQENAGIVRSLKVSTIPRYILIDPEGNFINVDVPGPQDPGMKIILDQVLVK